MLFKKTRAAAKVKNPGTGLLLHNLLYCLAARHEMDKRPGIVKKRAFKKLLIHRLSPERRWLQ